MKPKIILILACALFAAACSKPAPSTSAPEAPTPAAPNVPMPMPLQSAQAPIERPPIDLGDVDSGVFIQGILAPETQSETVTADYIETLRGTLSMTTITVKEPFPEQLMVRFEVVVRRNFEERPVVVRARALRGDDEVVGREYACLLGKDALVLPLDDAGMPRPRAYTVNALEGLDTIPETMLMHGRADAWLMPEGTVEMLLDPNVADAPDQVVLMGNPVRINFIKADVNP